MIVFDLDDTLYLEREFAFSGYRFLDGWVNEREGLEGFGNACKVLFEEGERRQIFNRALERLGHCGDSHLIADGPAETQNAKIVALGLDRWIENIRKTGDWPQGYGKPHPRAYEEMEGLAADGGPMVYVADNPAKDFVTPKARGWITVQIRRAGAVHPPHAKDDAHAAHVEITSLDELDGALTVQTVSMK